VHERNYPYRHNITACGLGDGSNFTQAYPGAQYVRIAPNVRLPFDDNRFEIATFNAALEHVGSFEHEALFVRELCRVARRVFISVLHKFFPIEHHTGLPVVHYENTMFRMACKVAGRSEWTGEENLILITRKLLWRLAAPLERSVAVGYTRLTLGPFSSNLYLAIH
jgi:hypothetical protein